MTTPILQPNHLSHTGVLLPAGRASFAVSSSRRMGLAHSFRARSGIRAARSFILDALDHQAGKLSDRSHRHVRLHSSTGSSSAATNARKRLDDGKILFSKTQKLHD